ncbi:branched-chain amino acid aminotransferase [Streptomyces sp. NRRL F-5755]|uniref:ScbR family autoregulator-binding transcription factor n=1 Tax=Streptomyces sp. NRRL F-5755 TaxID=1519475 RepID=UPI0006ADD487|nr:ScbR family autoregulator-binding transcription factor [Streptomyces sp. NRRL F-5755]KOT86338.1 branched-chain amino acid aminotransferase [Streptomyces sp. NRRL F-5755]KWT57920.1 branched-chain amino acid aminotransferase [Streptomyces albus subsp. albus]
MQERAVRTREVILRAAAEVFDEFGFSGASISKIMKRAGVTQGGMYFHFPSKEALAQAVMVEQGGGLELPPGEDGLQRLIDITLYLAEELQTNPKLRAGVRLAVEQGEFGVQDDSAYRAWAEEFGGQLRAAREKGELLPEVNVDELAWVLVSAYTGTQLFSQISSGRTDLHQRVVSLWRYLLPGVAAPPLRPLLTFAARRRRAVA